MSTQTWWYLIRASGLAAWTVLAADVVLGLLMSTGFAPVKKWRRLHSWLAGIGVSMVALHLVTLIADSYMTFDLASVLVPFASSWRTGAVAWGVVTIYLLAAVELTSLLRKWLPVKWWRGVHLTSFLAFWTATMHAVTAGTDLGLPVVAWPVIAIVATVLALLLLRIGQSVVPGARARLARRRRDRLAPPVAAA
jgi:predicted ferric reductase